MRVGEITFNEPVDAVLRRLAVAEAEDDAAEAKAKKLGCGIGIAVVCLMLSVFVTAETGLWPIPVAVVIALVVLIVLMVRTKKHDLDDRKLEAAQHFLRILSADLPRDTPVELRVDFRDAKVGGKSVSTGTSRVYRYEHCWLNLAARLADGNDLALSVTSDVVRKEKPKRKYTKVRQRTIEDIELRVKLDGRYGGGEDAAERLRAIPPPEPLAPRGVAGQGSGLRARVRTPQHIQVTARGGLASVEQETRVTGDTLLATLMWVYRGLSPLENP